MPKSFFLVLLLDGADILCHRKADIHHRIQHFSSGAGFGFVNPVVIQVGTH